MWQDNLVSGCQIHIAVQYDPLELGAVKLDIGEWAYQSLWGVDKPDLGDKVFVVYDYVEEKYYWIGYIQNGNYIV
jgi:hypothetical protein